MRRCGKRLLPLIITININIMADFFKRFESITSLMTYLDTTPITDTFRGCCHSEYSDSKFYGYESYSEAREKMLNGDKELAKKLRGTAKLDINVPATGTKKRMVTRVVGFMPHVPNFLAGVPNNMVWVEEKKITEPVITIVYNIGCLGSSSGDKVTMVSARIMSAIMSAERKGYRINLYVASAQTEGSQECGFVCKIKDSGQHIDTLKMAVPMISPAMNRRFGFRFRETMKGLKSSWKYGYGSSMGNYTFRAFLDRQNFKYDIAIAYESVKNISNQEELERMFIDAAKAIKQKH